MIVSRLSAKANSPPLAIHSVESEVRAKMCDSGSQVSRRSSGSSRKRLEHGVAVERQVALAEHHALGLAGRARGVENRGQIVGLGFFERRLLDRLRLGVGRPWPSASAKQRDRHARRSSPGTDRTKDTATSAGNWSATADQLLGLLGARKRRPASRRCR